MLNFTKQPILTEWIKFLASKPKTIIPALAIATSIVFYIVVIKFENYNWYYAMAYIKCFAKSNSNTFIQIWGNGGVLLQCSKVLQESKYLDALVNIIFLIIQIIGALIFTTICILTVFFLINKVIKLINHFNN